MGKAIHFLKYHNGVPLILGFIFLSSGAVFAANPEARGAIADSVILETQTLKSVDNSFIVNTNLDSFAPSAQITDVKENTENYYIVYTLNTIDLKAGAWGTVSLAKELIVSKGLLGKTDLGVYVAKELSEVTGRQS